MQKCLEHAAGVTEEDRVKNCILPAVGQYVDKLLAGINSEGTNILFCIVYKGRFNYTSGVWIPKTNSLGSIPSRIIPKTYKMVPAAWTEVVQRGLPYQRQALWVQSLVASYQRVTKWYKLHGRK